MGGTTSAIRSYPNPRSRGIAIELEPVGQRQAGATQRPGVRTDCALIDAWRVYADQVEFEQPTAGCLHDSIANGGWNPAIDQHGLEIDHRRRRDNGLGKSAGSFVDPLRQDLRIGIPAVRIFRQRT